MVVLFVVSGFIGTIVTFIARVGVQRKKTSGRSSGIIFINVNTKAPKTTTDVANTNVNIFDIKTGGSTTFDTISPTLFMWIVEKIIHTVQVKNEQNLYTIYI
jgi:hypothetical protein